MTMPPTKKTTVRAAVDAELRRLSQTATVYGRTAQRLADLLDNAGGPRDAAPVSRELRLVMEQIRSGATLSESDPLDELSQRRDARRSG
jgi:hypothetical protein